MVQKRKVYILLTNTGTLFTNLIKLYTKKPYNHASICFDRELEEVYSFGRKRANNPFIGGFVRENVRKGLFKQADCAIYSISVTEAQLQNMKQYIKQIELQEEYYRYNLLGLFGFIINKPIRRKQAFFCSQFVATVLTDCNIIHFDKPPSLISPADFQKTGHFQLVFEGKLNTYVQEDDNMVISNGNLLSVS